MNNKQTPEKTVNIGPEDKLLTEGDHLIGPAEDLLTSPDHLIEPEDNAPKS